jgi:type II secretory pathway component PulJ
MAAKVVTAGNPHRSGAALFGMRPFRATEHDRTFLLLVAFAVVLLASISTTMAASGSALSLIDGLQRDLGAVRAQLERADPAPFEAGQQSVAFNADLGDGGAAFRHRSMATILRSAKRRLESLATGYRNAGDVRRAEVAESAQLELQELYGRMHHLGNATDANSMLWARKRLEAEALIDRLRDRLVTLLPRPGTKRASDLG